MAALDDLNPFVVLRARARLENGREVSQADLARLAGVSEQYIGRQETGLINQPSARVNDALSGLSYPGTSMASVLRDTHADIIILAGQQDNYREVCVGVDNEYRHWVSARRATLKRQFEHKDFNEKNVALLVDRVTRSAGLMPSVYAFCRLLAIHVYAVQSALNDSHATGHLADALKESGIRWKSQ